MEKKVKRYVYLVTIGYESTNEADQYVYSSLSKAKRKMREKLKYFLLGSNCYKSEIRPDIVVHDFRDAGETYFNVPQENEDGIEDNVFGRIEKKELL